jgi:hypothetical protein
MSKDFQAVVGNIATIIGGVGGILVLLDWIIPKKGKDWIASKASTVWIWLSYQKTWPLIRKLQNEKAFNVFLILGTLVALMVSLSAVYQVLSIYYPDEPIVTMEILAAYGVLSLYMVGAIVYISRKWLRQVYRWITNASGPFKVILRALGIVLIAAFANTVFSTIAPGLTLAASALDVVYLAIAIFCLPTLAAFLILSSYTLMALFLYIVGIHAMIFLFRVSQALVRPIVEYDKGPVLGVAALLAAIGSILTAFAR